MLKAVPWLLICVLNAVLSNSGPLFRMPLTRASSDILTGNAGPMINSRLRSGLIKSRSPLEHVVLTHFVTRGTQIEKMCRTMRRSERHIASYPLPCIKIRHGSLVMIAISVTLCFLSSSADIETTLCSWLTPSAIVLDDNVCT